MSKTNGASFTSDAGMKSLEYGSFSKQLDTIFSLLAVVAPHLKNGGMARALCLCSVPPLWHRTIMQVFLHHLVAKTVDQISHSE